MQKELHNKIMRRIYYAYTIRVATNPTLVHGFLMLAMLIGLTYFVSLGNVVNNLLGAQVNQIDTFIYNAVANTEAWTYLLGGALIMTALSLQWRFLPLRTRATKTT